MWVWMWSIVMSLAAIGTGWALAYGVGWIEFMMKAGIRDPQAIPKP
jgi:hypothetical protein